MGRLSLWVLLGLTMFALSLHDVQVSADVGPTESECRPYIEKAINELKTGETTDSGEPGGGSKEQELSAEDDGTDDAASSEKGDDTESGEQGDEGDSTGEDSVIVETVEESTETDGDQTKEEDEADDQSTEEKVETGDDDDEDEKQSEEKAKSEEEGDEDEEKSGEADEEIKSAEEGDDQTAVEEGKSEEEEDKEKPSEEGDNEDDDEDGDEETKSAEGEEKEDDHDSKEDELKEDTETTEDSGETDDDQEGDDKEQPEESVEEEKTDEKSEEEEEVEDKDKEDSEGSEEDKEGAEDDKDEGGEKDDDDDTEEKDEEEVKPRSKRSLENDDDDDDDTSKDSKEETKAEESAEGDEKDEKSEEEHEKPEPVDDTDSKEDDTKDDEESEEQEKDTEENGDGDGDDDDEDEDEKSEEESRPEDDLLLEVEIPENLRDRKHIDELLHLDDEFEEKEKAIDRVAEIILRDLKRIYENAIKPLETLYKYRDLSNRHFGDPEIFSKPLILFMGPWSGGKSTIINYLTENEYTPDSLTTGAEPSPAYFNIVMYGNETEVLYGTQLAADWTFSGLQKFGEGLEDRLRGLKLPNKLLEKVNIVEIPGILEVRKQVSRLFPFNDACQWFIDRADIIFLVYDPAKLDVGPETEAILDQLKGREYQTRIILNKADTVKPEELLRVQSALIWNISPLMSSAQPPVMYTTSLWSHPYESSAPVRLLQAQERAFLRDIRSAIDKRIENKIASARRFAVRVRNHAKMVDCYLTTYYNHKTLFGNKKRISDQIIENPQNYHIYEGLSTLTNISRYDLPDPEVYRDFFRLNPLYEFKKLSETCTYFRGCPINKLDVAIAYDFPELVGKYKKMAENALTSLESEEKSKS